MKLRIKVTKDILEESMYCGTDDNMVLKNCAVALACREIFPDCFVDDRYLRPFGKTWTESHKILIRLPVEARIFIARFDSLVDAPERRANMQELEFDVELPAELVDAINIDEIRELLKSSKTLELIGK